MAQLLEEFERTIEPLVPEEQAKTFKAMVRRKMNALAVDAADLMNLEGVAVNGYAQDIKDRLFPDGHPTSTSEVKST